MSIDTEDSPAGPNAPAPAAKVTVPVGQALETATQLYLVGRWRDAERLCRQLLAQRPRLAEAHSLLGVTLNALGAPEDAAQALQRAVELAPQNGRFLSNLGEVERRRGRLDQARQALARAVELAPESAEALNNLGIVEFESKRYAEAAELYRRAIALQPMFPEAHNNLGNAYRVLGRGEEALESYEQAVAQREAYPEAYNNIGAALRDKGDIEAAEHAYRKAIQLNGDYLEAYNNLALLLVEHDRGEEALRVLGAALRLDGGHTPSLLNVARIQLKRGTHDLALQAALRARELDPKNGQAELVLAQVLHELDRHEEALQSLDRAMALGVEAADVHNFRGVILKAVGRLDEARREIRAALELEPTLYGAFANLHDLETFSRDSELLARMEQIFAEAEDVEDERFIPLHFAMGKALEDVGDYEKAFTHYATGARLRRAQLTYDEAESARFFDSIKQAFPPEVFENRKAAGHPSEKPVFIVGMPRSGSTLVEQILSSHSQIYCAGEVKTLPRQMGVLRDRFPMIPAYPAMAARLEQRHFETLGVGYLAELEPISGGAPRITDKLLTNYFFVGLIHLLFPHAKIVHTKREPMDTCLSTFTKLFKDDMPHSYDLGELGRYYRRYEDLMDHWSKVLPDGVMATVQYEELIDDLEAQARRLVAHLGLDWEDSCLAFHKSERPVKTASVVQVRKPVYRTSVERWRRYGPLLGELQAALSP